MPDLAQIIVNGSHTLWLYMPAALLLGALHAAEPGHSKSLMAAFIVAIRGTPRQAVLLGVSAALGHSLVVWAIALIGLSLGDTLILDKAEPWLLLASSAIIAVLGGRLVWAAGTPHRHDHAHDNDHDHHDHDAHAAAHARDIATRFGGAGPVGAGQIAWFGFTGGLTPCPAAITVLIVCLQVKALALGAGMVAAFSIGLAVTLVGIGIAASLGLRHAAGRGGRLAAWAEALPLISGLLILVLALNFAVKGLRDLGVL